MISFVVKSFLCVVYLYNGGPFPKSLSPFFLISLCGVREQSFPLLF